MKMIQPRTRILIEEYRKVFKVVGLPGSSMSFDCDKSGVVDEKKLSPTALDSYHRCLAGSIRLSTGTFKVVPVSQVEDGSRSYWEPALLQCDCGEEVPLSGFTNACQCGQDYNMSGQALRPRSEWLEEGSEETLQDILSIDNYNPEDLL